MTNARIARYNQNEVATADPGGILIALFDAAIRYGNEANQALKDGKIAAKGQAIGRMLAIVGELESTLDRDKAPELCDNLTRLYQYLRDRLQVASAKLDVKALDEVQKHLRELRETWAQAVTIARTSHVGAPPAP